MPTQAALPGAQALLGAGAVAALGPAVAAAGGHLVAARPTQVRYQPGRSLAVRFAADVAWGANPARRETLGALIDPRGLPDGLAVVAGADDAAVGVWRYPNDPFLPGLPQVASPYGARRVLQAMGLPAQAVRVTPVVYRPGSRAVLRLDVGGARLYAKVLPPAQLEPLRATHAAFDGRVRVPRCLGWSDPLGLVVLEALPGRTLSRTLAHPSALLPPSAEVLRLLDAIADVAVPGRAQGLDGSAAAHAALLSAIAPELHDEVTTVASLAAEAAHPPDRTIHGDFHQSQLLVDEGALVGVLDLDGARPGSAHDDPAVLLAHLLVLAHLRPRAARRIRAYRQETVDLVTAEVDPHGLRGTVAGVLLGLATAPFRRQEADWPARTKRLVELALDEALW